MSGWLRLQGMHEGSAGPDEEAEIAAEIAAATQERTPRESAMVRFLLIFTVLRLFYDCFAPVLRLFRDCFVNDLGLFFT